MLAAVIIIPMLLLAFRSSISPAGIEVTRALITSLVSDHEPSGKVTQVSHDEPEKGLYAFASIRAPQGQLLETLAFEVQERTGSGESMTEGAEEQEFFKQGVGRSGKQLL